MQDAGGDLVSGVAQAHGLDQRLDRVEAREPMRWAPSSSRVAGSAKTFTKPVGDRHLGLTRWGSGSKAGGRVPWVRAGFGACSGDREPVQEVLPAGGVHGGLAGGEVAVDQAQVGAAAGGCEGELDPGGARWQVGAAGHAPADHDPVGWVDLQVAPADGDAVDVDLEDAAGGWDKGGVLAHPADHGGRVGQVPEDLLEGGGKVDAGLEQIAHAAALSPAAGRQGRPARL